ncbi:MAG TPA: helix-hairpin-helix domain-containing protein [Polyangiaceae bacterium]|nr:helix-hairpin-helix domain-containing protein [Polyangiaceae bacterium]
MTISRRSAEPRRGELGEQGVEAAELRGPEGEALAQGRRTATEQGPQQRWRAWGPILARALATALALLGLAGIGWAARGSNELAALTTAPLSFGLAQIASSSVAASSVLPAAAVTAARPLPCAPAPAAAAPGTPAARPGADGDPAPPLGASAGAAPGRSADGRVILHRASAADLQRLPGVGAKRAAAILALRQRLGQLRRPSDLLRVKGIGPRLLERMLPLIVVDASSEHPP